MASTGAMSSPSWRRSEGPRLGEAEERVDGTLREHDSERLWNEALSKLTTRLARSGVTGKCSAKRRLLKDVSISGYCDVKAGDEAELEKAVSQQVGKESER